MKLLNSEQMVEVLDSIYGKAVNGLPKTPSAIELADDYLKHANNEKDKAILKLIKVQTLKSGTTGFITGLGGLLVLPVAIPANLASVFYIQLRMIAAIAHMNGYDIRSDEVKTFAYMCLTGDGVFDIAKQFGIKLGNKVACKLVEKIPGQVLRQINKKVGFMLVTKFGKTGLINIGKMVPLAGGIVGLGLDAMGTKVIAKIAVKVFNDNEIKLEIDDDVIEYNAVDLEKVY